MILYCDTSALVKRYVEESGTEEVDSLWEKASVIATSTVAFAESFAVFARKFREGLLTGAEHSRILQAFRKDYSQLILVPVTNELNGQITRLSRGHALRGFDLIHLASAVLFTDQKTVKVVFACFDAVLNGAASKEGLETAIKIE